MIKIHNLLVKSMKVLIPADEIILVKQKRNVKIQWNEHENPNKDSVPAKILKRLS